MNIVFIIDQVYLHGGIERVLSIKANYLAQQEGNKVHIITTEQKEEIPCYAFDKNIIFRDLGINYNRRKSYFHPKNLKKLPKHISRTKAVLKTINPDIVVVCSHSVDTYFVPFIVKDIPKVKEFHYSRFIEKDKRKKPSLFKKYFFKFADYVESKYDKLVILNKDESDYYKTDNTVVIPNPLTFYPDKVSELSNNTIITAGRIAAVKGHDILIDIWEEFTKIRKDWQLLIFGNGEPSYVKMLQDKINSAGIQDTIKLMGSTNEIKEEMIQSSVFVMTSHNECFPLVLLEAQACGLPIVSFDCPYGPRNIIDKNTGVLITPYDNDSFVDQLDNLLNDTDRIQNMGKKARENSKKYQLDVVMKLWQEMFNDLIHKK
ncbi:Glycosyltransferase involved in cell wall bisynthesis [Aquimarina amphilecti]|uniref:Glycosyltransferase involved in cell wall bisynthesis n=1 Tax=Aquimarina amphilecti TaxID=1038014 RepID=A0A1H7HTQ3_AQUAM|nr:glycosyltransferase family 4 protein [Aquimarina amphilecti]SEK53564.1 Glycosyltransferase involved in cell wall bisynthesis [Aquimarina amphilecti]